MWRLATPGGVVCWVEGDEVLKDHDRLGRSGYSGTSWRHALHLQDLGFTIWEVIITGVVGMRYPIRNRYSRPPVYVFILSRGKPRTLNILRDRKNVSEGQRFHHNERLPDGSLSTRKTRFVVLPYGVRTTVWLYPGAGGSPVGQRHPAPMHRALARDLIGSYSRAGDLVCDPFAGACTTGEQAVLMGRDFVGYEIYEPYYEMGRRRLWAAMDHARREKLDALKNRLEHLAMALEGFRGGDPVFSP